MFKVIIISEPRCCVTQAIEIVSKFDFWTKISNQSELPCSLTGQEKLQ